MKRRIVNLTILVLVLISTTESHAENVVRLSPHVTICQNSTNGVFIKQNGRTLVIYGDPGGSLKKADMVLFTHNRRDVTWSARELVDNGAESVVPAKEVDSFSKAEKFWASFIKARFGDYHQQTTKIPIRSIKVNRKVRDGDTINWQDLSVKVLDTPGYTRGAVSYFVNADGIRYGFVGDIIFGDGQLFDLYSLQDAVPDARIGGYHGYAGRLGELISSLRKVNNQNPDILIPARGPVIKNPKAAIEILIKRLQAAYKNYLSINAGHWYFKDRYEILAKRVLEPDDKVDWAPYAETIKKKPPDWIVPIHNSRLILSKDGTGFLVDCGSRSIIQEVIKLRESGRLSRLDGLFITHYHNDHTNEINELVRQFKCPVYASRQSKDILENPGAYRLPCLTLQGVPNLNAVPDGHKMRWKEYNLTFYYFPGQTLYHDALLVEKDNGERIFFIGDSFTPSGIDDYCLQNRNFLHKGMGFLYCLDMLKKMRPDYLLINQHVVEPFRYSQEQVRHMIDKLNKRRRLLAKLFPWDEPNYGVDEKWARIYPYGQKIKPGQNVEISVKIFNHSNSSHTYTANLNVPKGFRFKPEKAPVNIQPRVEKEVRFEIVVPNSISEKVYVVTSDIKFDKWDLRHWSEAIMIP
ncbi:MAG: MBL fold metallo-hydrolase [Phycisphaerae bacterium]|nr:MBL fold metallo-hydrolase [Phycisphaerae bacterium]NIT57271.1 MBL fold metallo-hydrolase [Fodinibius sp.]NIS51516.1 MBL fold metallo-hydrolase [Phycisphaerae bacterium]NIU08159.1 MBL fold metallo-hydrolase [Phycisphaerae bacterium]NIU55702.1 MBL fold metallo-hydrolase [Phycisphaerae bacterium]